MRPKLIICGASDHGLVVADAVIAAGTFDLLGFADANPASVETMGIAPILGSDTDLTTLVGDLKVDALLIAIGDNHVRQSVTKRVASMLPSKVVFPVVVHPKASVAALATIGAGSVVLAGAVIGLGAAVGAGCIVNTQASLDHHGVMADYASLAPGVMTGGHVMIGEGSAISIGATILQGRSVGDWSVVGAGSLVMDDVPGGVTAYGTPARTQRPREPGDRYL